MKKSLVATLPTAFLLFVKGVRGKIHLPITTLLLAGCTTAQVHWDAVQMREHVMDYYNDEIMENLIRAKQHLPFVHVDIVSLSAVSGAKISGTVNGGQTLNNTDSTQTTNQIVGTNTNGTSTTTGAAVSHMVAGTIGVVGTLTHLAMRPFTVSVTPENSDTVTIVSNPVSGVQGAEVLYELYTTFVNLPKQHDKCSISTTDNPGSLREGIDYVPDTMKRWRRRYYYVPYDFRDEYSKLCFNIFTKVRAKPANLIQSTPGVIIQ
jgi:hypothetical protein